jgi:hypothetical protein
MFAGPARTLSFGSIAAVVFGFVWCLVPVVASSGTLQATAADEGPVALGGNDPLGYFLLGTPAPGSPFFTLRYRGLVWNFQSTLNRATFLTDPDKFAPQYGGACAEAASRGETVTADPKIWRVLGGKLYVFRDEAALENWLAASKDGAIGSKVVLQDGR